MTSPHKEDAMHFLTAQQIWLIFLVAQVLSPAFIFCHEQSGWRSDFRAAPPAFFWGVAAAGLVPAVSVCHIHPMKIPQCQVQATGETHLHSTYTPWAAFSHPTGHFPPHCQGFMDSASSRLWKEVGSGVTKWRGGGRCSCPSPAPSPKALRIKLQLPRHYPCFHREGGEKPLYI